METTWGRWKRRWGWSAVSTLVLAYAGTPLSAVPAVKSLAEQLGYKATDKLLIIHADDAGMCHSANVATIRAMEQGVVTSASVMVPCPWFPEIARYCREHPDADFGIHLTLTSEWGLYRWRPVAPIGEAPGLLDAEGFLPRGVAEVVGRATPQEVEKEIRAQVARARGFGVRPTHIDTHMGTLLTGKFYQTYLRLAKHTGIVPMVPSLDTPKMALAAVALGLDPAKAMGDLRAQGFPLLDFLNTGEDGDTLEARQERYYGFFRSLKPGVTQVIVHLSLDDEEIRGITGSWEKRYHEYRIFTDPATRRLLDELGIKRIGYRELARLFPPR